MLSGLPEVEGGGFQVQAEAGSACPLRSVAVSACQPGSVF